MNNLKTTEVVKPAEEFDFSASRSYFGNSLIRHKLEFLVEKCNDHALKDYIIWNSKTSVCNFLIPLEPHLVPTAKSLRQKLESQDISVKIKKIKNHFDDVIDVLAIGMQVEPANGYRSAFSLSEFLGSNQSRSFINTVAEVFGKIYAAETVMHLQQSPALDGVDCFLLESGLVNTLQLSNQQTLFYRTPGHVTLSIPTSRVPAEELTNVKTTCNDFARKFGVPGIVEVSQAGESLFMIQISDKYYNELRNFGRSLGLEFIAEDAG